MKDFLQISASDNVVIAHRDLIKIDNYCSR